jgi:hypothetical protein
MTEKNRRSRKKISNKKKGGWQIESYIKKSKNIPIINNTRTRSSQKRQIIRQNKITRRNNLLS